MKSIEEQLKEALELNKSLAAEIVTLKASVTESNKAQAAATLANLLSEAKLPAPAAKELNARFKDAIATTGMQEAVAAYADVFKETIKKNNGAADNAGETQEGDAAKAKANLVESWIKCGYTKEEAERMSK